MASELGDPSEPTERTEPTEDPSEPTQVEPTERTDPGWRNRVAQTHRFLRMCEIVDGIPFALARRAAELRTRALRGSAVDALVVALADGVALTSDAPELTALAAHADRVRVERV